jgi:hypothetical protein
VRLAALGGGLLVAVLVRIALWPLPGLAGDLDDFARWAGSISRDGLGPAYSLNPISFPPVLPWIWAGLGALVPALAHADAAGDAQVRAALKLPASLADLVLAAGVGYALGPRRWWAVAAVLAVALQPAAIYLSAWWGQFESLYVLPVVVAYLLAVRGRLGWAGVALAVALMTKPQALPLALPFAAWVVGRAGWRGALAPAIAGAATIAVLWAPFAASGGPLRYLDHLRAYGDLFSVISLRAWNPWWLVQLPFGTERLIADTNELLGPITFRIVGVGLAALLGAAIAVWIARRPTPAALAWGLIATSLAAFCALTTMHERYAYPAVALLPLLWPDRRAIGLWLTLSVAFTLNVVASVPPSGGPGTLIPVGGVLGAVGAVAMTACLGGALLALRSVSRATGGADGVPVGEAAAP